MTDTHSHIYGPEFDEERNEVITRAKQRGVRRIFLPNINEESIQPMLDLCQDNPGYCFPMMGLHPEDVKEDYRSVLQRMHERLAVPDHPYIAVGEVGLDFYWDTTYREQQLAAFEQQVEWACALGLPLMIHCRAAQTELVQVLECYRNESLTGVFHCFGGSVEEALQLLDFPGFALGIGGVLTYKKSPLPEVVRAVPLDRIVLETDAPYLAPVPHRGKRNESSFVADTLLRLAQEVGSTEFRVEEQTEQTVNRIFRRAVFDSSCRKD